MIQDWGSWTNLWVPGLSTLCLFDPEVQLSIESGGVHSPSVHLQPSTEQAWVKCNVRVLHSFSTSSWLASKWRSWKWKGFTLIGLKEDRWMIGQLAKTWGLMDDDRESLTPWLPLSWRRMPHDRLDSPTQTIIAFKYFKGGFPMKKRWRT